jgi:hypothetical protein
VVDRKFTFRMLGLVCMDADEVGIHTMGIPLQPTLPTIPMNTAAKPTKMVLNVPQIVGAIVTSITKTTATASNA